MQTSRALIAGLLLACSSGAFAQSGGFNGRTDVVGPSGIINSITCTDGCSQAATVLTVNSFASVATKTLFVDGGRGDTYVENGSRARPFKTIMAAVNQVITNGDNVSYRYAIQIAMGVYAENIVLENAAIHQIALVGEGVRQTVIDPSSGNALQSTANNSSFEELFVSGLWFAHPTVLTGSVATTTMGVNNLYFENCYWTDTASFTNVMYPVIKLSKFSGSALTFSNVTQAIIYGEEGTKTSGLTLTIQTNETANKPSALTGGTRLIVANALTPNVTWSLLNITTLTGTTLQLREGARYGVSGETIPQYATILAYNSSLIGSYTVASGGTLSLYGSEVSGTLTVVGTLNLYQPASQVKNDSTVAGTTVKDALDSLNTLKAPVASPTFTTSATVQGSASVNGLVSTALATPVNAAFSQTDTGGSLLDSTSYCYRITGLNDAGESLPSTETCQVTSGLGGNAHTVVTNWGAVTGAKTYKVYGRTTAAELYMATVTAPTVTWTDTGAVTPSGAMPTYGTTGKISGTYLTIDQPTLGGNPISYKLAGVDKLWLTSAGSLTIAATYSTGNGVVETPTSNTTLMLRGNSAATGGGIMLTNQTTITSGDVVQVAPDGGSTVVASIMFDGSFRIKTSPALQTCAAAVEGAWTRQAGGTSGARTKICLCTSDGGGSPVYAWQNITSYFADEATSIGNTSTCP